MTTSRDDTGNDEAVVHSWIAYHESEGESDFWAVEKLLQLVFEQPQRAWEIILRINFLTSSHPLREYLDGIVAAGPLEDLVHAHGKWMIGQVEERALQDERLREQLGHMYLREDLDKSVQDALSRVIR